MEKSPLGDTELSEAQNVSLGKISEESSRVDIALEFFTQEKYAPFLEKRREALKGIPKFWPVALLNHPTVSVHAVHHRDQVALSYLEDVWLIRDPKEKRCFTLEFYFKENPFFSDPALKKEYRYSPPTNVDGEKKDEHGVTDAQAAFSWDLHVEPQAIKITWKDDAHNLTKAHPRVLDEGDELSEPGSFFNLFEFKKDHMELGVAIANEIFPEAIEWYKGTASQNFSDDDEDEEDEEDDEVDEEIDLEKPRPKKQRT